MRRFSQRNALVTLNEINITPLLDLAFVLLIIFIITTPMLEQGLDLKLPSGGRPDRPTDFDDIRTVEVGPDGRYMLSGRFLPLAQISGQLAETFRQNPNLVVYIRADENVALKHAAELINICEQNGIKHSLRTVPPERRR
ncbi:MAG TPA: biopolymer transporter ExbD [Methylomirabilota bacterium]|nr:biopolymer transporter ExbD [Methylomirabilota bacterium]